jgi:hypothetical protein
MPSAHDWEALQVTVGTVRRAEPNYGARDLDALTDGGVILLAPDEPVEPGTSVA